MSIHNILVPNQSTLYCKKLFCDDCEFQNVTIDHITVDNATVLTQVTTPHITSGTSLFNTIDTTTINALTGNMGTINSQTINSLNITTENLSTQDFTANNATINDLSINNNLDVPTINTNNIISNNGTINNLTSNDINCDNLTASNNISSPNGTINDFTSINSTINTLNVNTTLTVPTINSNDITSNTGNISTLTSSDINCVNLTASNNINSLNGNIDNLIVNNSFSAPLFEAPEMHVDYVKSYSVGKTTFQENVVVDTQFNCPIVSADTIQTNGSGTVNIINDAIGTNLSLSGALKSNTLQTVSGSGNITSTNNIIAPTYFATSTVNTPLINNGLLPVSMNTGITFPNTNAGGTTNLKYYLQSTGSLTTSGAVVTSLNYRATRIGGQVNVCVQCMDTSVLATANTFLTISGMPSDFLPNSTTCCGPILTNTTAGVTIGRYQFNGSGDLLIFASLTGGVNFLIGQPCGLFGGTVQFATFTFSRTT